MKSKRAPRGRFWHFVQSFWQPHGGYDVCDEWYPTGGWYADISPRYKHFKISFPYHLELQNFKKYSVRIDVNFGCHQRQTIARIDKISSKKEAIRQVLKTIKEFENSPRAKEVWQKLMYRVPIVKIDKEMGTIWIATSIFGSIESSLYKSNFFSCSAHCPLGSGTFYYLSYSRFSKNGWSWSKIEISGFGYSSCTEKNIPISVWLSIKGFNKEIDDLISKAEKYKQNSKFVLIGEDKLGLHKANQLLLEYIENETCKS